MSYGYWPAKAAEILPHCDVTIAGTGFVPEVHHPVGFILGNAIVLNMKGVETEFGFHVIKAVSRKQLPTPPLDEVKSELQRELTEKRQREEVAKWVEELKNKAFIDVRL